MTASYILNTEEQKALDEAKKKFEQAATEMIARKDSGEITVFFHDGKFKRAKKNVTV